MKFTPNKSSSFLFEGLGTETLACAYSLRLLTPNYRGPLIKVRRDSDNTTRDIYHTRLDLDCGALLEFVGTGSGFIDTWYDQSANSNNLIQTNLTLQPRIVNTGIIETLGVNGPFEGGLPTIRGFGTGGSGVSPIYLESSAMPVVSTAEMSIFYVSTEKVRQTCVTLALAPVSVSADRITFSTPNSSSLQFFVGAVSSTVATTVLTGDPACYNFNFSAIVNLRHIIRNNVIVSNASAAAAKIPNIFRLFSDGLTNFDGGISEFMIFKSYLQGNGVRTHISYSQNQYFKFPNF